MDLDEPVFKPRHAPALALALYGLPLAFFGLLCASASIWMINSPLFWGFLLLAGILASLVPFFTVRLILFRERMVIRRYLLPDISLNHDEVQSVDASAIHTNRGRVRLGGIRNAAELQEQVRRWQAARVLKASQPHAPQKAYIELPQRGYGTYAVVWGLLFGIIGLYLVPASLGLDARWVMGGIFVLVYLVYIYVLPRVL